MRNTPQSHAGLVAAAAALATLTLATAAPSTATDGAASGGAAVAPAATPAQDPHVAAPGEAGKMTHAEWAFNKLKAMVGTWDADLDGNGTADMVVTYRLIANGSVVAETLFAGTPKEMETMFHLDGERLLCTHYCAAGNQPRLNATDIAPDTITFEMVDATNLPDRNAMHMGKLKMVFKDNDHVSNHWTSFDKGQDMGAHEFAMSRRTASSAPAPAPAAATGTAPAPKGT